MAQWHALAGAGQDPARLAELFRSLVEHHYDPAYKRSQRGTFLRYDTAQALRVDRLDEAGLRDAARQALALTRPAETDAPPEAAAGEPGVR
jgi:hypothetical protein